MNQIRFAVRRHISLPMLATALFALCVVVSVPRAALAQEPFTTNRATEMRATPDDTGMVLETLPAQAKVQLLERKGAWSRVKTEAQTGWVRMMHLRGGVTIGESAPASRSGGGFLSGFNRLLGGSQQTNQRAQSATLGIRGLSPEELQTASPNPQALAQMKSYSATKPDAEKFAKEATLARTDVADPGEPARGSRR